MSPVIAFDIAVVAQKAKVQCCSGLRNPLEPWSLAARKWRENEKMKRKWRENEEMRKKWRENEEKERLTFYISSFSLHFLPLSPFPTSIFSHFVAAC